ncbi:hypothetical protein BASA83_002765 [Batrachochytrium salamandrivorans]|nr:hypothetical protein BASA83_002765 [Batrachochytrium salamandrivorans]
MSYAYSTEPPTKGKVILHTTVGELEIELWPKEAPKACRNFLQLCLEGFYDNTIFHRVVPDFIAQGGDPTGTGLGGESIYGGPFQDEYHTRLRFTHRGLLAMANTGPNSNRSQFFFTLGKTEELNRQNTIFGKIVGDTIYNLLKIGELEIGSDERPIYPAKILNTHIMSNPFDDIIPRTTAEDRAAVLEREAAQLAKEQDALRPKSKKNLSLLSFGEEAEETTEIVRSKHKILSMHDAIDDDSRLVKQAAVEIPADRSENRTDQGTRLKKSGMPSKVQASNKESEKRHRSVSSDSDSDVDLDNDDQSHTRRSKPNHAATTTQDEIRRVSNQIRSIGKDPTESIGTTKTEPITSGSSKSGKAAPSVNDLRRAYLSSGKAVAGKRKAQTTSLDAIKQLEDFQKRLRQASAAERDRHPKSNSNNRDTLISDKGNTLGCQSCRDTTGDGEDMGDVNDVGWMTSKLVFGKELGGANVYKPKIDDYSVFDPRQDPSLGSGLSDKGVAMAQSKRSSDIWQQKAVPGSRHSRDSKSSRGNNNMRSHR